MGSGTSLLSPEDSEVLTQILKEEYGKLISEGFSEREIQQKLTSKYNEIIASISSECVVSNLCDIDSRSLGQSEGSNSSKLKKRRNLHGIREFKRRRKINQPLSSNLGSDTNFD